MIAVAEDIPVSKNRFINPDGYTLTKVDDVRHCLILSKAIYEFTLDDYAPLTFELADGTLIQPDRHMERTDMGSIPMSLQVFFPKDRFLLSYILHDSGYKHNGLYVQAHGEDEFTFMEMTRAEVDHVLAMAIRAEGGNIFQVSAIYSGVRIGGWGSW